MNFYTTLDTFMIWYGGPDWFMDWEVTDQMTVNGDHAQYGDPHIHLNELYIYKDEVIDFNSIENQGELLMLFTVNGVKYEVTVSFLPRITLDSAGYAVLVPSHH